MSADHKSEEGGTKGFVQELKETSINVRNVFVGRLGQYMYVVFTSVKLFVSVGLLIFIFGGK